MPIGTFVQATISGKRVENVFRVPRTALRGASQLLFVDPENKVRIREVGVVRSDAEYAYIRGGVSAGDRLIVTAIESPVNGMSVRSEPAPEGTS